jgi:hypothetical protein
MQILATGAVTEDSDTVRAFEIPEAEAVPVSVPLMFEGTIKALWGKTQGDSAVAVVQTPMGTYEAYNVSVACSQ